MDPEKFKTDMENIFRCYSTAIQKNQAPLQALFKNILGIIRDQGNMPIFEKMMGYWMNSRDSKPFQHGFKKILSDVGMSQDSALYERGFRIYLIHSTMKQIFDLFYLNYANLKAYNGKETISKLNFLLNEIQKYGDKDFWRHFENALSAVLRGSPGYEGIEVNKLFNLESSFLERYKGSSAYEMLRAIIGGVTGKINSDQTESIIYQWMSSYRELNPKISNRDLLFFESIGSGLRHATDIGRITCQELRFPERIGYLHTHLLSLKFFGFLSSMQSSFPEVIRVISSFGKIRVVEHMLTNCGGVFPYMENAAYSLNPTADGRFLLSYSDYENIFIKFFTEYIKMLLAILKIPENEFLEEKYDKIIQKTFVQSLPHIETAYKILTGQSFPQHPILGTQSQRASVALFAPPGAPSYGPQDYGGHSPGVYPPGAPSYGPQDYGGHSPAVYPPGAPSYGPQDYGGHSPGVYPPGAPPYGPQDYGGHSPGVYPPGVPSYGPPVHPRKRGYASRN